MSLAQVLKKKHAKLAQHYQASYQPGIWWVLNRGSESAHSRGGYSSGFWTVSCCWLLRALGGGRCSAVLFLMEQATFRPACTLQRKINIRWDWCYHFQNDHNGSNTESKNVHSLCVLNFSGVESFFRKPPVWNFMPFVNEKIFSTWKVYIIAHFQAQVFFFAKSTSQFLHPQEKCVSHHQMFGAN